VGDKYDVDTGYVRFDVKHFPFKEMNERLGREIIRDLLAYVRVPGGCSWLCSGSALVGRVDGQVLGRAAGACPEPAEAAPAIPRRLAPQARGVARHMPGNGAERGRISKRRDDSQATTMGSRRNLYIGRNRPALGFSRTGDILDDIRVAGIRDAQAADAEELAAGSAEVDVVYREGG
jgi:hypothetical protein